MSRISLNEENLKTIIKECIKNCLNEIEDFDSEPEMEDDDNVSEEAAIDFYDFYDILENCGWSFSDFEEVQSKDTGKSGLRYRVHKDSKDSCDFEELVAKVKEAATNPDGIIPSTGHYRYAPEIKASSIIILNN